MAFRDSLSGEMLLLVQKMRAQAIYYRTKLFLKLVKASSAVCLVCVLFYGKLFLIIFYLNMLKAKQMPVTPQKLRRALKTKHPYVERNLGTIVNIIRHAMQNSDEFQAAAQGLKDGLAQTVRFWIIYSIVHEI